MSKNSEEDIIKRLDTIISILLNNEINNSTQLKKIEHLTKMSFNNDEIARILSTTKGSIEAQKYKKPKAKKVSKKIEWRSIQNINWKIRFYF